MDRRRIIIFLAVAFGFTWSIDAVIWLTGGLADSPELVAGLTLALPLLTVSMFGPAIAVFVTRWVTKEGWANHRARFNGPVWPWVAMLFGPSVLAVVGTIGYFLVFPDQFDASMPILAEQLAEAEEMTGEAVPIPAALLGIIQIAAAFTIAPLINAIPAFGEEFGWRGYLQWKLRPLGWTKMLLATNVIWSVWHWPVIAMGHNYGFDYPGAPWTGFLAMTVFTLAVGAILGWSAERTGSALPAALGHGAINATAAIGLLFLATGAEPSSLLGPAAVGLLGGVGLTVVGVWLMFREPAGFEAEAEPVVVGEGS
ncbi:MAG: CPBP family intramembrane metalloprotease [Acidimicrobiia bacterium]|nr:CPBP family intramembrane metalloprotease [Acidimicrobiia bacterium]